MFPRRRLTIALSLAFAGATPLSALAQTSDTTLPEVRSTDSMVRPGSPRDSITTGSKTDTPIRDLPATVIVVPSEILQEQGVRTMNQALENVSGVQPQMAGGYGFADNYSVRGLPMRWLRDGLPDGTSQNGYFRTMFDVERIEVLKGPGSALYGTGQPGGSVNVVTRQPNFRPSIELGGQIGSFGTRATWADVNGPLSANVAGRVIVGHDESDGWRGLSRSIDEVLPSIAWRIADDKVLNVDYDHRDIHVKPDNFGILFDRRTGQLANVSRETRYYSPMNYTDQTIDRLAVTHDWQLSNALSWRIALVADERKLDLLRNVGATATITGSVTGRSLRAQKDNARYNTFQNELIWKTQTGPVLHTVLAGVEYSESKVTTIRTNYSGASLNIGNILAPVVPETSLTGLTSSLGFDRTIKGKTTGVYVQDQIALSDSFKVRAGLRSDYTRYEDIGQGGTEQSSTVTYREVREAKTLPSGSLGAVWQPHENWSLYAGTSTGQFVNLATEGAYVGREPEKSIQKEVGVKASLLDSKLGVNLAFFETERENYYIQLTGAGTATPNGKDRTRGVELDLTAEPIRGLNLLANFVSQDPEMTTSAQASNPTMGVTGSIQGKLPTGVAKQSGRIWGSYTLQSGELKGLGFGLGTTYKGESYADSLNLFRVPGYTVWDAGIFYRQPKWEAALNLKNLSDRTYYTNPTFVGALPGESRSALLTVKFKM